MVISCPVAGIIAIVVAIPVAAVIPWTMTSPAPTITKTVVIPAPIVIPGTIIVGGPPPIVSQIDTYSPACRRIIIPVHVGKIGVVITKTIIWISMKTPDSGRVVVVVIIIIIIIVIIIGNIRVPSSIGIYFFFNSIAVGIIFRIISLLIHIIVIPVITFGLRGCLGGCGLRFLNMILRIGRFRVNIVQINIRTCFAGNC